MISLNLQRRPVANLTLEQQVAMEHPGLGSLPGYVLVVFEKRDQGGAVFSRLVSSGESFSSRFKIPFRDLSQKYFAIAVNDSVLSCSFDHSIALNDGSEELTINFHLTYRVVDAKKVAETLEHDPLRQLRDEVVRVIGRNCAKRKAEMFRERFRDLERIVIDSESARLRPFAAELGFKIISIDLDMPLPVQGRKKAEVDEARREKQKQLREIQEAVAQALLNVGAGINTPAELREGFDAVREIPRDVDVTTEPVTHTMPAMPESTSESVQPANGSSTVVEDTEQFHRGETWKDESSRLIKLLEEAGADADTTTRVRDDLEAIAARYFPSADVPEVLSEPVDEPIFDSVMCSVFTPPAAYIGGNILVQVFAHLVDDSEAVKRIAAEFDEQSKRLASKLLTNEVRRNAKLTFCISMPGLEIDEPVQELVWCGQPDVVQFGVHVPKDLNEREIVGTIYVSQNGVPFGHVKFLLRIGEASALAPANTKPEKSSSWKRYEYAFISYAAEDRTEVLKRVQMLPRFHIDFFQDLLTLEPGDQWEDLIFENIDRSDVFFLFWSTAARNSEWVMNEIRHALKRKGIDRLARPEIVPVMIEGPPPVPPPAELQDIHFNDRFMYFMNAQ